MTCSLTLLQTDLTISKDSIAIKNREIRTRISIQWRKSAEKRMWHASELERASRAVKRLNSSSNGTIYCKLNVVVIPVFA